MGHGRGALRIAQLCHRGEKSVVSGKRKGGEHMPYVLKGHARFNREKNLLELWADPIETAVRMDEETAGAHAPADGSKDAEPLIVQINPSEVRIEK